MDEGDTRQAEPTRPPRSSVTPTFDWFLRFLSFEVLVAPWLIRILYVAFSVFAVLWLVEIFSIRAAGWGRGPYGMGFLGWLLSGPAGIIIWLIITLAIIRILAEALFVMFQGARDLEACRRSLQRANGEESSAALPGWTSSSVPLRETMASLPLAIIGFFGAMLFSVVALWMGGYAHERSPQVSLAMTREWTGVLMLFVSAAAMALALRWGRDRRETWLPGALRAAIYLNLFLALLFGATAGQSGFDIDLREGWYLFIALQVMAWLALRAAGVPAGPRSQTKEGAPESSPPAE